MAGKKANNETPMLEWIAGGVGLVLTLLVLAVIGRQAMAGEAAQAPAIEILVGQVAPAASGYIVEFEASNRSGGTGAAVEVEGTLKQGKTVVETSRAVLDYVPGHSQTKGGIFFTRDPKRHVLEVRALGFQQP